MDNLQRRCEILTMGKYQMHYILETKSSSVGKWRPVKYLKSLTNKDAALELAREYDEHGLIIRVMERGHSDGMDRTVYTNVSSRQS